MANTPKKTPAKQVLGSKWDGLSKHLLATIFPVEKTGANQYKRSGSVSIQAPMTEANIEITQNWQSPFEGQGIDANAPFLSAGLQAGASLPLIDSIKEFLQKGVGTDLGTGSAADYIRQGEGRSTVTKLNSTQIFQGMPPLRISGTLLFRAWDDPQSEVEAPIDQLMQWLLPEEISEDASVLVRLADAASKDSNVSYLQALMPSKTPKRVALQYKGRTYSPLVIEAASLPIQSHVDKDGRFVEMQMNVTFCSLTALDQKDWIATKSVKL